MKIKAIDVKGETYLVSEIQRISMENGMAVIDLSSFENDIARETRIIAKITDVNFICGE